MPQLFRLSFTVLLCIVGVYFGVKGFAKSVERFNLNANKINCAKLVAQHFTISFIFFFLAIETYTPSLVCVPFLFLFIGLIWLEYTIYRKTSKFLGR